MLLIRKYIRFKHNLILNKTHNAVFLPGLTPTSKEVFHIKFVAPLPSSRRIADFL